MSLAPPEQHLCLPQEQYYFDESAFLEEEEEEPDDDDDDTYTTRAVPTRKRKKAPKLPKPVKVKVAYHECLAFLAFYPLQDRRTLSFLSGYVLPVCFFSVSTINASSHVGEDKKW